MFKNDGVNRTEIADLEVPTRELTAAEAEKIEGGVMMTPDGRTCTEPVLPGPFGPIPTFPAPGRPGPIIYPRPVLPGRF